MDSGSNGRFCSSVHKILFFLLAQRRIFSDVPIQANLVGELKPIAYCPPFH
jgi:hypothetical protein